MRKVIFGLALAGGVLTGCGESAHEGDKVLIVSIEPLKYIVSEIVGDDFEIHVLVPPGATPETYEPTPEQMAAAENARAVFSTGLIDFEQVMIHRLPEAKRVVDLSLDVELIDNQHIEHDFEHDGSHGHGRFDPHIWMSPRTLAKMARTAYQRIHRMYPDSTAYTAGYERLTLQLANLDQQVGAQISASGASSFMIFHPGLGYFARDYGLRQIALETDGKEPSIKQLAEIVSAARAEHISTILYQREFPVRVVEVAAEEIGASPAEIDILGFDVVGNILKITDLITR